MFSFPDEDAIVKMSRVKIRFLESLYFFQEFKTHCGSHEEQNPEYSTFRWIAHSDAFLVSLLSIQDLVGPKKRDQFLVGYERLKKKGAVPTAYSANPLLVLKLMRNRTVHHCVFGAPGEGRGKGNVSRVISLRVGGADAGAWVEPRILFSSMKTVMKRVREKYRRDRKKKKSVPSPMGDIKETQLYIQSLQERGVADLRLERLFLEGCERVGKICGLAVPVSQK